MASYYEGQESRMLEIPEWLPDTDWLNQSVEDLEVEMQTIRKLKPDTIDEYKTIGEKIQLINWVGHVRDMAQRHAMKNASLVLTVIKGCVLEN